jgi:hypothetical protein
VKNGKIATGKGSGNAQQEWNENISGPGCNCPGISSEVGGYCSFKLPGSSLVDVRERAFSDQNGLGIPYIFRPFSSTFSKLNINL